MAVANKKLPISAEEVKDFAIQQGVDCVKCVRSYQPFGLSHFVGFLSEFVSKTDEEKQKALRNP